MIRRDDGSLEPIEEDRLYCVACGMYMAQMLGSVKETSMGLLSLVPRDAQGNPLDVTKLADYVIRNEEGTPVKEWYAIASYLDDMGEEMDPAYAQTDGRKVVYSSLNPVNMLKNANHFTWIAIAAILVLIALIAGIIALIRRRINRKRK